MKIVSLILVQCTICYVTCLGDNEPHELSVIMDRREHTFCLEVKNNSIDSRKTSEEIPVPEITIWLDVDYPFDVAEAGHAFIEDLSIGLHNVSYKYRITNMTHDLLVKLDGVEKSFRKSAVPRWTSVSTFREINLILDGPIQLLQCEDEPEHHIALKAPIPAVETSSSETRGSFFIFDSDEDSQSSVDETLVEDELFPLKILSNNSTKIHKVAPEKPTSKYDSEDGIYTVLNSTGTKIDQNRTDSQNKPNSYTALDIKDMKKPDSQNTHNSDTVLNFTDTKKPDPQNKDSAVTKANTSRIPEVKPSPSFSETIEESNFTDAFSVNHSAFETNWSESREECGKRSCISKDFGHDYTLAFILFGILGAIALIAAVISIVFHRKKKKLMVSGRDRPTNRLRQKLQEESFSGGETQLMLRDVENTYEEIR